MPDYRVDFFDGQGRVFASRELAAENDAAAINESQRLCRRFPDCSAVEVWLSGKRVHRDITGSEIPKGRAGPAGSATSPDS